MKCFKNVFLIFLISLPLFAQEYNVEILNKKVIEPGDEVEARISRVDGVEREKFFEGQIINNVLFVLVDNSEKTKFLVKAAPPLEKQTHDNRFVIKGAQFKNTKTQTNYTLFGNDYVYEAKRSKRNIYILGVLLILTLFFIIQYLKKRKMKLKVMEKRKELLKKIKEAYARKEFEDIYAKRLQIEESLKFEESDFKKLLELIYRLQYQKNWTDEQLSEIKKSHKKIIMTMEIRDGL